MIFAEVETYACMYVCIPIIYVDVVIVVHVKQICTLCTEHEQLINHFILYMF